MSLACSVLWDALSAWGTAGRASFWIALEQNGSWGRDALVESGLDPAIGAALTQAASAAGGKIVLIRRPGRHAEQTTPHRVAYVAGGLATTPWLRRAQVADPAELLDLPWRELAGGRPLDRPGFEASAPVLLVCTNAKRDRCCALRGRPVLTELAAQGRDVWECTHTGGHRFAPTGVVLPFGQVLARVTPELGAEVLDAAAAGRLAGASFGEHHDRSHDHRPSSARCSGDVNFVVPRSSACRTQAARRTSTAIPRLSTGVRNARFGGHRRWVYRRGPAPWGRGQAGARRARRGAGENVGCRV